MAGTLSPNTKQRGPFSPSSPFFLGSNDDNFERAQARAARAAAFRRKSLAAARPPPLSNEDSCLDKQQILELFQNCIKLASENKINQKNTWELNLIDHLCEVIKVEEENDAETNFQKASCTLEAGVKIYSMRVDSVHSEAYKVLGGINRVGQEEEQDIAAEDVSDVDKQAERRSQREEEKKLSPLSTLESSFEALNVKKFDVAFAVDPLYHQTSAQFDEGGAKGLLLNNLGIYGNCQVLFDSLEVPGKCTFSSEHDSAETIDLNFARECIEQMVLQLEKQVEISPSLGQLLSLFDDNRQTPYEAYSFGQNSSEHVDETFEDNFGLDGGVENNATWGLDQDDLASVVDDENCDGGSVLPDQQEEGESYVLNRSQLDDNFEKVDEYLLLSLGFPSKRNAWAGPDHWKYQKLKDSENVDKENAPELKGKRAKQRKAKMDIDFTKALEMDIATTFSPPTNPRSILLPTNRAPCNTRLPEDCHYQPENLVKLFLLPNVMCLGRRRRKLPDEFSPQMDNDGPMPSWDDDNGFDGACDVDNGFDDAYSNIEDSSTLVSQPRQVNKIEVQYDKTSKQVDVQVLKETLWDTIHKMNAALVQENTAQEKLSFKQMLATFPSDCRAAASIQEISPHLCFICLLHLANEHGLRIEGHPNLDDLTISSLRNC